MQIDSAILRQSWILAGPTASGKTAVSLRLAELLGAEIVSLDSMTLYRRMDIGTAKPSASDRARVPHHLIDILEPDQDFTLAAYLTAAEDACREILGRGRIPLFVGGTGLYLRGLLRGVFDGPSGDPAVRHRLAEYANEHGEQALHELLRTVDPESAERLHPNDGRRLIRALEVHELTGLPLSAQQRQLPLPISERPAHVYWLEPPRDWLHVRIDQRVQEMFAAGLVDEVRGLLAEPGGFGKTAGQALGYKEVVEHLQGIRSLEETIELIQTRTRQFAKRQHTWFRNQEECRAVQIMGDETGLEIAALLYRGRMK